MLLLLAAAAHAEPPIDNLTMGVATGLQAGYPMVFSTPVEFTFTGYLLDFLAIEGRIGVTPGYPSLFAGTGTFETRYVTSGAVRIGRTEGWYGALALGGMYPFAGAWDPDRVKGPAVLVEARGGYRFVRSDRFRISPEVHLGFLYLGAGVQFEWKLTPR